LGDGGSGLLLEKSSVSLSKALSVTGAVASAGGGCNLGVAGMLEKRWFAGMLEKRWFAGMLEKRSIQDVVLASLVVNADLTV
jgi:hypothetical protein